MFVYCGSCPDPLAFYTSICINGLLDMLWVTVETAPLACLCEATEPSPQVALYVIR